jgi:hypothetical protein
MTDKIHTDTQNKIETITYIPSLQDSGNLEVATKSITATSKPGSAGYSVNLTTTDVNDSRVIVRRLCQRLNIHIDSFGGAPPATKLYYSVAVNGSERVTGEFNLSNADNFISWDLTLGQFNLGSANAINVYLWVDQGNAIISLIQLWQGVGSCTNGWSSYPLEIACTGLVQVSANFTRVGSGSSSCHFMPSGYSVPISELLQSDISSKLSIVNGICSFRIKGSVTSDLNYFSNLNAGLYSL